MKPSRASEPGFSGGTGGFGLREAGGYRVFAEILLLGLRFDLETLAEALGGALSSGRLSARNVRQLCLNLTHALPEPVPVAEALALTLAPPDLTCYDLLCGVAP